MNFSFVLLDGRLPGSSICGLANSSGHASAPPPFQGSAGPYPLHCCATRLRRAPPRRRRMKIRPAGTLCFLPKEGKVRLKLRCEYPLATATSRSANAVSGKQTKQKKRQYPRTLSLSKRLHPHCKHRPFDRLRRRPQQNTSFKNKPLPAFAPLCRVFRYPLCGAISLQMPRNAPKIISRSQKKRELRSNSVARAASGQRLLKWIGVNIKIPRVSRKLGSVSGQRPLG